MFEYGSVQYHMENGKVKMQKVHINGSKGYKEVVEKTSRGKTAKKSRKPLTKSEIRCIKKCQFIPGLFKDCKSCIKNSTRKAKHHE